VGLDTTYYIANIMFEEYREKPLRPAAALKRWSSPADWAEERHGFLRARKK